MRRELRHRRDLIKAVIDRKGVGYWKGRDWEPRPRLGRRPRLESEFDFTTVSQDELPEVPATRSVGLIVATVSTVSVHPVPALPEVLYRRAS